MLSKNLIETPNLQRPVATKMAGDALILAITMLNKSSSFCTPSTSSSSHPHFDAWLTVGEGKKFASEIIRFNETLKAILITHKATAEYEEAIEGENPRKHGGYNFNALGGLRDKKITLLIAFFNKYPVIKDFFKQELNSENSVLNLAHDSFNAFNKDLSERKILLKHPDKTTKDKKENSVKLSIKDYFPIFEKANEQLKKAEDNKKNPTIKEKPKTTITVSFMFGNKPKTQLSHDEYVNAFKSLNKKANERIKEP